MASSSSSSSLSPSSASASASSSETEKDEATGTTSVEEEEETVAESDAGDPGMCHEVITTFIDELFKKNEDPFPLLRALCARPAFGEVPLSVSVECPAAKAVKFFLRAARSVYTHDQENLLHTVPYARKSLREFTRVGRSGALPNVTLFPKVGR